MKVLLVAPRKNDLYSVDEEVQDILRSGLNVKTLLGKVTATELIREIREGDFDVLWLATHGDNAGIELSGIERITASELVPQVRGRFSLVVLNSCNGFGIAKLIQEEANVSVICSVITVSDQAAYKFGSRLSSALAELPSVADAYLASRFGHNDSYLHLPALIPHEQNLDNLLLEVKKLQENIQKGAEKDADARQLLRYLIWISLGLHVPEWVALGWLAWIVLGN
jgi:hypothetical protein